MTGASNLTKHGVTSLIGSRCQTALI